MEKKFLDTVHGLQNPEELRAHYDEWADSYDAEVMDNGYATPARIARALAAQLSDLNRPILDYGCGTGLSGAALIQAGFTAIDGADLSAEMLSKARDKGVYRDLWQVHPDTDLPFDPGKYGAITAMGVIGSGAAPAETLDLLVGGLAPGGLLGFSYNDKTIGDPDYEGRLRDVIDTGRGRILFEEYGDHLPKFDMKATVYILERI